MIYHDLYRAAELMKNGGYSSHFISGPRGCFSHRIDVASGGVWSRYRDSLEYFLSFIGYDHLGSNMLQSHGWTTKDAVAALTMAADCAFEEGL